MIESLDERRRFATLLTGLADYYRIEVSKAVASLYWEGLKQYDYDAVEKATWAHTQTPDEAGRWMPKISDLTKVLQGRTVDQASVAWSKVDKAVRQVGTYQDVVFDDAIIHRVIDDIGGWIWLGKQTEDEWPFVAKRFESSYRGYKMRNEIPPYIPVMIGISNAQNGCEGMEKLPAVLIGNAKQANQVHIGGSKVPLLQIHTASQLTNHIENHTEQP